MRYPLGWTPVDGVYHIEARWLGWQSSLDSDDDYNVVVMRCGLLVTVDADAVPSPLTDWVADTGAESATCPGCREAVTELRELVQEVG
jgi:hypothetical protein